MRNGATNAGFVHALYRDLLYRTSDDGGAQSWTQVLNGGVPRNVVAATVLASQEADAGQVQSIYHQFLHRAADPGGFNTFVNALQRGMPSEQLVSTLAGSEEYFARL